MGDRVAVMRKGELQQVADPQTLYDRPVNLFVGGFIGSPAMNMIEATLERQNGGFVAKIGDQSIAIEAAELQARPGLAAYEGKQVVLGIRPEDLEDAALVPGDASSHRLRGHADLTEALGSEIMVHFSIKAQARHDRGSARARRGRRRRARSRAEPTATRRRSSGASARARAYARARTSRSRSTRARSTSSIRRPVWASTTEQPAARKEPHDPHSHRGRRRRSRCDRAARRRARRRPHELAPPGRTRTSPSRERSPSTASGPSSSGQKQFAGRDQRLQQDLPERPRQLQAGRQQPADGARDGRRRRQPARHGRHRAAGHGRAVRRRRAS